MRPEDRPKAIGLAVGVVIVFALVGMRVKTAFGGAGIPQPEQPVVPLAGKGGQMLPPAQAPGENKAVVVGTGPASAIPSDTKEQKIKITPVTYSKATNPFRDREEKGDKPVLVKDPEAGPPGGLTGPPNGKFAGSFEDSQLPRVKSGPGPANPGNAGLEVVKDPEVEMQLTGVITGGRAVAVIRVAGKDYVVSAGDTFGNGYKLVTASNNQVVVVQGLNRRVIKMSIPMG